MITALVFIIILAFLILVHEWGHFWTARKSGVKVEEFGFGFPPRLWGFKWKGTLFSINLIPLGGFVRIFGEDDNEKKEEGSFAAQPIHRRAKIIAAGVIMNLLSAFILLSFVQALGVPTVFEGSVPENSANPIISIVDISPNSPAEKSGLRAGDGILEIKVKDELFKTAEVINKRSALDEFGLFIRNHAGESLVLNIKRGKDTLNIEVTPRVEPPIGEGALGIAMAKTVIVKQPLYLAPWEGLKITIRLTGIFVVAIGGILKELFVSGTLTESIAGPVGIVKITAQTIPLGSAFLLQLIAILSINIALINALPFPALDGGRLLFLLIEKIRGRPVKKEIEQWVNTFGFFLLILFMIVVTIKDINRFF